MSVTSMTTLPRRRRMWVSVLLALMVFSGGIVIGGAGTVLVIAGEVRHAIRHPEEVPVRLTQRLTRRLNLDADQSAQVQKILTARLKNIAEIRATIRPQVKSELTGIHDDVRDVLTPQQQGKWDDLYDDFIDNWFPPPRAE
jgi:hypothetical protein